MKKILTGIFFLMFAHTAMSQTFNWAGNYAPIRDHQVDTIPIVVSGLPAVIDTSFGIGMVCLNITHTYKSDLVITLQSPFGDTALLIQAIGGSGDNFTGTCLAMDGTSFSNSSAPYTGIFIPLSNIAKFNNGQNPNGTWKVYVADVASLDTGSVQSFSLQFTNNPPRGNGNFNVGDPTGVYVCPACVCPGGAAGCDLLPDVTASAREITVNHTETPGLLYISNATPNIGYGPIEIFGIDSCFCGTTHVPCNTVCTDGSDIKHVVKQRIYQKVPGTDTLSYYDRIAGMMTYHAEHGHIHVDNWSNFTLRTRTADPDPRNWPIVGTSVKQSFCLINLGTCSSTPGECVDNNGSPILTTMNNNVGFHSGCGLVQGIYPGNYDVYNSSLNDPIPLNGICNGDYYIVSITDPNNVFLESDETNNWVAVPITLTKQNLPDSIKALGSTQFCLGDSVTLTASSLRSRHWSTGDTSRSIVVHAAGNYTVTTSCGSDSAVSNTITVTIIPANTVVTVNITRAGGNTLACPGQQLIFHATHQNGGPTPVYQWKVNGVVQGTNSPTFTSTSITDGQVVTCTLISSIHCLATPVVSNSITVPVNTLTAPNVSILQTKGKNPSCLGDSNVFKAIVTNYSSTPVYQWKVNGINVGTNADSFLTTGLTNGQVVSCQVQTVAGCPSIKNLGTDSLFNLVTSDLAAAYPSYYGNGRQQYLIKASELTAIGLTAGPINSIGFNVLGTAGDPATLNGYTIKLGATTATTMTTTFQTTPLTTVFGPVNYTPQLNLINTHNFIAPFIWDGSSNLLIDICYSNQVIGNAAYQNTQSEVGFNATTYLDIDNTAGAGACTTATGTDIGSRRPNIIFNQGGIQTVLSGNISMSVNSAAAPTVSIVITNGAQTACAGSSTTFTAIPNNTGSNPLYQWLKNGVNIPGENNAVYTSSTLANGDTIECKMITGAVCDIVSTVKSNKIGVVVIAPDYTFIGNGNWTDPNNWSTHIIPPAVLPACSQIFIDPVAGGECLLNTVQTISPGAKITVMSGKKFKIPGNLILQ